MLSIQKGRSKEVSAKDKFLEGIGHRRSKGFSKRTFEVFKNTFDPLYKVDSGLPMLVFVNEGWRGCWSQKELIFQTNCNDFVSFNPSDYASISLEGGSLENIALEQCGSLSPRALELLLLWVKECRDSLIKLQEGEIDVDEFYVGVLKLRGFFEAETKKDMEEGLKKEVMSVKTEMSVTLKRSETGLAVDVRVDTVKSISENVSKHQYGIDSTRKAHGTFGEIIFPILSDTIPLGVQYRFGVPAITKHGSYADITPEQVDKIVRWLQARAKIIIDFKVDQRMTTNEYKKRLLCGK